MVEFPRETTWACCFLFGRLLTTYSNSLVDMGLFRLVLVWVMVVCIFQGISPFHLSYQNCGHCLFFFVSLGKETSKGFSGIEPSSVFLWGWEGMIPVTHLATRLTSRKCWLLLCLLYSVFTRFTNSIHVCLSLIFCFSPTLIFKKGRATDSSEAVFLQWWNKKLGNSLPPTLW